MTGTARTYKNGGDLKHEEILVVGILGFVDLVYAFAFAFTICKENAAWDHLHVNCKI